MSNSTHRKDFAKWLARETGLGYQRSLDVVVGAHESGFVPSSLRDTGSSEWSTKSALLSLCAQQAEESKAAAVSLPGGDYRGPQVIAVTSLKGGVGKSSLALSVAAMAARHFSVGASGEPFRACVVDLLTGDTLLPEAMGRYVPTALNLVFAATRDPQAVADSLVWSDGMNLAALLAPVGLRPHVADISEDFYRETLATLKGQFDLIVLDAPPVDPYSRMADFAVVEADLTLAVASNVVQANRGPGIVQDVLARAEEEVTGRVMVVKNQWLDPRESQIPMKDFPVLGEVPEMPQFEGLYSGALSLAEFLDDPQVASVLGGLCAAIPSERSLRTV